jgi:uncharacterized protein (TIGR00255 family)
MIKSMTGFAQTHLQQPWGNLSIEIKSVNHRYLESNIRLPETLRDLEMSIRELFRQYLQRGKIDCQVRYTPDTSTANHIAINQNLLTELLQTIQDINQKAELSANYNAFDVLRWPGIIEQHDDDAESRQQSILQLIRETLQKLNHMRTEEGIALTTTLLEKLACLEEKVMEIKIRANDIVAEQRSKLQEKCIRLQLELDPQRLEQEVVLLAHKSDVAEELDRLAVHISQTRQKLQKGGTIGRELDFLMQEFNREVNTLASKSIDITMTQTCVTLKVLIEQMREQIQNIE